MEVSSIVVNYIVNNWEGSLAILLFVIAYGFVIAEEQIHMRKCKPVLVASGFIWILAGLSYSAEESEALEALYEHNLVELSLLFFFLLSAMTYVNTMYERNVFEVLRAWLVGKGFSFKSVFWITGLLAFFLSPVIDNLTTALVMGAVVLTVGRGESRFIVLACINVVVAANAGGAFSPFGDITTLMVWQAKHVTFTEFFALFVPSLVNWLVPAMIMSFFVVDGKPSPVSEDIRLKKGAVGVIVLFVATVFTAVLVHNFLHLPAMAGMMTGLGALKIYGYFLRRYELSGYDQLASDSELLGLDVIKDLLDRHYKRKEKPFDVFVSVKRAEWDTLFFFFGVVFCVGGLGAFGYLAMVSEYAYASSWNLSWIPFLNLGQLSAETSTTMANTGVGILSAIVDNIPVMFAVLTMNPDMSHGQWLLATLTAGVGGSMLSIGSAAGVALMGQARGIYTFKRHLVWMPVIALGYFASILVHLWLNASLF